MGTRGRLLVAIGVATFVFALSRSWATQLATRPISPVTRNACPAEFFVVAQMPDGQYALMASFDYSDELKSHFYRGSQDRNLTRLFLKERWPTAEILWQDFSDVSLQLVEAEVRDAENFVNSSLAEAHEKSGLFPSSITFQVSSENRLNSESHYSLVIDRGHIPEIYRYQIDGAEFSPEAYIMENRLGGLAVSLFLSAIVLILIQLLSPLGRFLRAIGPRLPGDLDGHK